MPEILRNAGDFPGFWELGGLAPEILGNAGGLVPFIGKSTECPSIVFSAGILCRSLREAHCGAGGGFVTFGVGATSCGLCV